MSLSMIALMVSHENAEAFSLKGTVFDQVGQEANIDPVLLYSIALCESGFNPSSTKIPKSRTGWLYNQPAPYFLRLAAR